MFAEDGESGVVTELLAEGIFVDDIIATEFIKNRGGDPWFKNEPSADVDAFNLVRSPVKVDFAFSSTFQLVIVLSGAAESSCGRMQEW
jgi:hypothetical protein